MDNVKECRELETTTSHFWKANQSLIPKIQKNEMLDQEEKDKLILNDDPIVQKMIREFKKDKKQVYEDLENALIYTKNHKEEIKDRFGNVTFFNLLGGLKALKKLINQFINEF